MQDDPRICVLIETRIVVLVAICSALLCSVLQVVSDALMALRQGLEGLPISDASQDRKVAKVNIAREHAFTLRDPHCNPHVYRGDGRVKHFVIGFSNTTESQARETRLRKSIRLTRKVVVPSIGSFKDMSRSEYRREREL